MSSRYDVIVIGSGAAGQLKEMLADRGIRHGHLLPNHAYVKNDIPVAVVAHQAGTCRYGSDPASPVLNADRRAPELDDLHVVDPSSLPSTSAVNPALTAMANATRAGDRLVERTDVRRPESGPGHVG